jgi:NADH oxidase (H2O2-forming)
LFGVYLSNNDIIIIGCGAAGGTAAQFARKTDRKSQITIFEKGKYPQYSKCGLPYAISGKITKLENLIEFSEEWFKKSNIDLLLETTVEKIDIENKIVIAKKGKAIIEKPYCSIIIATGASPLIPPIKNIFENDILIENIYTLRTIDDARNIMTSIKNGKNATIIGAGLIGLEMADSLLNKGMNVTVVEALPNILQNNLDKDMSNIILNNIETKVKILPNHIATSIENKSGKVNKVSIKNQETDEEKNIETDLLIISAGLEPNISLAKDAGCNIGKTGHIIVNRKCETSVKNIYAIGDCTEFYDIITKNPVPIGLGSIAVRQGIASGVNAAGGNYELPDGLLQTCTSEFFGMEIASVGPNVIDLPVVSGKYNGMSLPHYFPGGKPISVKVFVEEKTGKIIAAQAVGKNAAKRIDIFACAMLCSMNVETLKKLETAYAPPIAPTLDAETLACDVVSLKLSRKR